jgi:hypothetical protein
MKKSQWLPLQAELLRKVATKSNHYIIMIALAMEKPNNSPLFCHSVPTSS